MINEHPAAVWRGTVSQAGVNEQRQVWIWGVQQAHFQIKRPASQKAEREMIHGVEAGEGLVYEDKKNVTFSGCFPGCSSLLTCGDPQLHRGQRKLKRRWRLIHHMEDHFSWRTRGGGADHCQPADQHLQTG